MLDVKLDKGKGTMNFAGSGQEIAAEIGVVIHGLYVQLYRKAGPAIAKGCRLTLLNMLAREDSPVWDVSVEKGPDVAMFMSGASAAAMMERMRRSEGQQRDKD